MSCKFCEASFLHTSIDLRCFSIKESHIQLLFLKEKKKENKALVEDFDSKFRILVALKLILQSSI